MDPQIELAFKFASDLSKQLITLSTGILALTITFTKDLLGRVPRKKVWTLKFSWIAYLSSIFCGIWHLMALTGTLVQITPSNDPLSIGWNARLPASLQILTFLFATVLIMYYGVVSLDISKRKSEENDT